MNEENKWDSDSETGALLSTNTWMEEEWLLPTPLTSSSMEWIQCDVESGSWSVVLRPSATIFKAMLSLTAQSEWLQSRAYSDQPCTWKDAKVHGSRQLNIAESSTVVLTAHGNMEILVSSSLEEGVISITLPMEFYRASQSQSWWNTTQLHLFGTPEAWKLYIISEPEHQHQLGETFHVACITVMPELERPVALLPSQLGIITSCSRGNDCGSTDMNLKARLLSTISMAGSSMEQCWPFLMDTLSDVKSKAASRMPFGPP